MFGLLQVNKLVFIKFNSHFLTCHQNKPVAPAEVELQAPALEVNTQRSLWEQAMIAHRGADQKGSGQGLHIGPVSGNGYQQQVHQEPRGQRGPEHNARKVSGGPVLTTPRESLAAQTEVLGHGQNGKGQSPLEGVAVVGAHVVGPLPGETLVVVDVRWGPVANGNRCRYIK